MGFFKDAVEVFKKRDIPLVEKYQEADGVYTFLFEKEEGKTWKAGQHGLFTITHKKVKPPTKPFSVASAPAENRIQITTRISENPSDFKRALMELEEGMTINMSGPVGPFFLKNDQPTLLIAGGIGITPFRSILKQMEVEYNDAAKWIELVYIAKKGTHLFKKDLDQIARKMPLRVVYLDSRKELYEEIDRFAAAHETDGHYYVGGPKAMVEEIVSYLQDKDIKKRYIHKDVLEGY